LTICARYFLHIPRARGRRVDPSHHQLIRLLPLHGRFTYMKLSIPSTVKIAAITTASEMCDFGCGQSPSAGGQREVRLPIVQVSVVEREGPANARGMTRSASELSCSEAPATFVASFCSAAKGRANYSAPQLDRGCCCVRCRRCRLSTSGAPRAFDEEAVSDHSGLKVRSRN